MKTIEQYLKLLPIATLVLIIASSTKLAVYYSVFNINIVEYLTISEYVPLFIDDLHSLIYVLGTMLVGGAIAELIRKRKKEKKESDNDNESTEPINSKRYTYLIFSGILLVALPLILYFKFDSITERLDRATGLLVIFMFSLLMVFTTYEKVGKLLLFLWIIAFVFSPLIISGYKEAYTILENKEKLVYSIDFKDLKQKQPPTLKYLGSSNKFIFLYNPNNLESIIQPLSNLEVIRIKEK